MLNEIYKMLENLSNEELEKVIDKINELREKRNGIVANYTLYYNQYKGSGKCWIAVVDKNSKKVLSFAEPENTIKDGYKGTKEFKLKSGYYLICQEGSKSYDKKEYVFIDEVGNEEEF